MEMINEILRNYFKNDFEIVCFSKSDYLAITFKGNTFCGEIFPKVDLLNRNNFLKKGTVCHKK